MTISAILLLLQLATSLLIAVQQNSNLPASFREQAFQSANQAIQVALQAIQTHPENPPTVAAVQSTNTPASPMSTDAIENIEANEPENGSVAPVSELKEAVGNRGRQGCYDRRYEPAKFLPWPCIMQDVGPKPPIPMAFE